MAAISNVRLTAAGFSDWIVIDRYTFGGLAVSLGVKLSSNGSLTYSVQHTFDDILNGWFTPTSLTRSTTTATVTRTNHGLSANDWVYVSGAGSPFDTTGAAVAGITDQNNFTYTVANSGATSAAPAPLRVMTARVFNHSTLASQTASADGNYSAPPMAVRLNVTSYAAGYVDLTVIQAGQGG